MGRAPIRAKLVLDEEARSRLESIAKSRTEGHARIERAKVLLAYHAGARVTAMAATFQTNRPKIERILNRALEMGAPASLEDRPGRGRKPEITAEARAWLMSIACTKPVELGYPKATADDQPSEGVLNGHGTLSPSILADTPRQGFDGDERGVRQAKPGRGGRMT